MASRDKKPVGRKAATPTTNLADTEGECPTEEKIRKVRKAATKQQRSGVKTKAVKAKVVVVVGGKNKRGAKKNSLLQNGVIRKRAVSVRAKAKKSTEDLSESPTRRRLKKEPEEDAPKAQRSNKRMKKGKDAETTATNPATLQLKDDESPKRKAKKAKTFLLPDCDIARKRIKSEWSTLPKDWTSKVIDALDLNGSQVSHMKCLSLRRHSIAGGSADPQNAKVYDTSPFAGLPKTATKTKRRLRLNVDGKSRSTRSDSRILRNGKTRRLQQFPLFDGLDSEYKMRRRLASDFSSGGEMPKLSGYESDSSLSSSLEMDKEKEKELLLKKELLETLENNPPDSIEEKLIAEDFSAAIKRSLSMDQTIDSDMPETSNSPAEIEAGKRKTRSSMKKAEKDQQMETEDVETQCLPEAELLLQHQEDIGIEEAEAELIEILAKSDEATLLTPCESTKVNGKSPQAAAMDESPESLAEKSQILKALGLQTLQEAEEARKKQGPKGDCYTGTLKTVIKLSRPSERDKKKASRNPIKMTLQKKGRSSAGKDDGHTEEEDEYKVMKDGSSSWKSHGNQSSDTAGAARKSHYSNRSNMDGSSEHTSDGDTNTLEEAGGAGKLLVIPEKASSFSIHPGRLCKDECTYCFGKFGLFDTPCHIGQLKTVERQEKILANEKHLTRDSCLCDACYRHVDRKANMPQYANNKSMKPGNSSSKKQCGVIGCNTDATNWLKRKWIMKMRRVLCPVINLDLTQPGPPSVPVCSEHWVAVEHLMVCAMCKRRLSRNHIHYLGPEAHEIQRILSKMLIPVQLQEKPVVCKLCRFYSTFLLKNGEDFNDDARNFFVDLKKRLLQMHNLEPMDDDEISASFEHVFQQDTHKIDQNAKKRKRFSRNQHNDPPILEPEVDIIPHHEPDAMISSESRANSPSDYMVDYRNLIPNVAIECISEPADGLNANKSLSIRRISKEEALEKKRLRGDTAVQRLGSNPSISIRQMFPGEEDVPLNGYIEFNNAKERTPEGWEKCTSIIQYDSETKMLWHELQKPYGNQSSFLRHLILLEKYFRNGDLVLSSRASSNALHYTETVNNRLRAYDNIASNAGPVQPLTMLPFNNPRVSYNAEKCDDATVEKIDKSQTSIIPVAMSTPNANCAPAALQLVKNSLVGLANLTKARPTIAIQSQTAANCVLNSTPAKGKPPALIALQQGNKLAGAKATPPTVGLLAKPQSQKIKFPITKNWRPKLIPIDPLVKPEKKPGLVQVISGGKPYHITLEDYKKMCAIKRTYDLRQKRLQETLRNQANPNSLLKTAAVMKRLGVSIAKSASASNQDENVAADGQAIESLPNLPRIPKSLTVIPQTVTISKFNSNKVGSRPTSPNTHSTNNNTKGKS